MKFPVRPCARRGTTGNGIESIPPAERSPSRSGSKEHDAGGSIPFADSIGVAARGVILAPAEQGVAPRANGEGLSQAMHLHFCLALRGCPATDADSGLLVLQKQERCAQPARDSALPFGLFVFISCEELTYREIRQVIFQRFLLLVGFALQLCNFGVQVLNLGFLVVQFLQQSLGIGTGLSD